MGIDAFLEQAASDIEARIAEAWGTARQWVLTHDDVGVAWADVTEPDPIVHELLASLVGTGADAAAYVSYLPDVTAVMASVLVTRPVRNSDLRRSAVVRGAAGHVTLVGWAYCL